MALSGEFYGTTSNAMVTPKISWSATQSVEGNYSTVTATLYYSRTNTGYTTYGTWSGSITVNGATASGSKTISITYNSNTMAISTTVQVPHNADGTKSVSISASGSVSGTSLSATYISSTVTLNTVPRKSSIESITDTTLGEKCTVKWTPAAASFSYKVKLSLGGWSYTSDLIIPETTAQYIWSEYTIPLDAASEVSGTTDTMTAMLYSYSDKTGTTEIGTAESIFTVTVPKTEDTIPSVTLTVAPVTSGAKFLTSYIQTRSKVQGTISATGKYGASIVSSSMSVGGVKYSSPFLTDYLSIRGDVEVTATVTDSRGFTNTATEKIYFIPYDSPRLTILDGYTEIQCYRSDESGVQSDTGTMITIRAAGVYTPFTAGSDTNTCTVKIRLRQADTAWPITDPTKSKTVISWSGAASQSINQTIDVTGTGISALSSKQAYEAELYIIDDFYTSTAAKFDIPGEDCTLHLKQGGKAVGVGMYVTEKDDESFHVAWDSTFHENLSIIGNTTVGGNLGITGSIMGGGLEDTYLKKAGGTVSGDLAVGGKLTAPTISGSTSITGDLTVTGTITGGGTMDYLPLSGGTITGDLMVNGSFKTAQSPTLFASGTLTGGGSTWYITAKNIEMTRYKLLVFIVRTYINSGNKYMTFTIPALVDKWGLMVPYGGSDYFRATVTTSSMSSAEGMLQSTFQVDSSGYETVVYIYGV